MTNQYQKSIADREAQINQLQQEIKDLKSAWISSCHPLQIGDLVTLDDGREIEVHTRGVTGCHWTARGWLVRKDGKPGGKSAVWAQEVNDD